MNKSVVIFSITVAAIILTFLLFSILAILFQHWGDTTSVKDSLSIISGIFGGVTTLGAAIVAAYLFNDWKVQHNKQVQNTLSLQVFEEFIMFEKNIREFALYISHLESLRHSYDSNELTWEIIHKDGHLVYIQNINLKKEEMDLNFHTLMDKLRSYFIYNNETNQIIESNRIIYSKFYDINKSVVQVSTLLDHLIDYNSKYIGYLDLKNIIDSSIIKKIIISLNA